MYRLRDLKNGLFQIHGPKAAFEGTPRSIFTQAVKMGVSINALTLAVNVMSRENHDYADFSNQGTFLHTKKNRSS